jgi:Polyketide cyclase / dehydrase and lipid transport
MKMPRKRAVRSLLLLTGIVTFSPARSQLPASYDLSWADPAVLEAGAPVIQLDKDGRVSIVEAAIVIDAPRQSIWDVLVACEIAPEYVPNVVACRSLDLIDNGRSELFIQTVKPAFFIPSFEHVFRMDYMPYDRIDIHRVSGPIKQLDSSWWLTARPDGKVTLVYYLVLDPGLPIPRVFVRATLRRDLPRVLAAISERSRAAAQLGSDGARR